MSRFEEAKAKAARNSLAVAIIYTNEKTDCPKNKRASLAAADRLSDLAVVVYADSDNDDWGKLPKLVQTALKSKEAGSYIPKVVVTDAKVKKVIVVVPYADEAGYTELLRQARARVYNEINR
ncbi:MAG: hypothetical protein WC889_12540 [Myxococcota bacterium]